MANEAIVTAVLGAEYDEKLQAALCCALKKMGARRKGRFWGLGGSQELHQSTFVVGGRTLTVEAESYVGLSVCGPKAVIEELRRLVDIAISGSPSG